MYIIFILQNNDDECGKVVCRPYSSLSCVGGGRERDDEE